MTIHVAMLRGINVSGQKTIKMETLRVSFEALGFRRVRSYVQSGNVIFEATKASSDNLPKNVGGKILSDFGFSVPLVLRTSGEMKNIASDHPFFKAKERAHSRLHGA